MTETAHTPGPWFAVEGNKHHGPFVTNVEVRTICDLYTVDKLNRIFVFRPEEAEANARLIAAAPDLLEALKALQRQALQGNVRGDEWMDEALELTRAAIAKAEGRA